MSRSIVAYMTNSCTDCASSRQVLRKLGVKFHEIDVESSESARQEMRARNGGSDKVPTIIIDHVVLIEPTDDELREALRPSTASNEQ